MIKRNRGLTFCALACLSSALCAHADNPMLVGEHVSVGQKVTELVGPGPSGEEFYYASYIYEATGDTFDLVSVNPLTGAMRVYSGPSEEGARGMALGPDGKIYLGTVWNAKIMEFDPRTGAITDHGRPGGAYAETYIPEITLGSDGNIYAGTYPNAKLVRYNPTTQVVEDLGKVGAADDMYMFGVVGSTNGYVFGGTGSVNAKIVAYRIATGEKRVLLESNKPGFGRIYRGQRPDENVYAKFEDGRMYRLNGFDPPVSVTGFSTEPKNKFSDGSQIKLPVGGFGDITVTRGSTTVTFPFTYGGKPRFIMTFTTLASGPTIYGSGILDFNFFAIQESAFNNIGWFGGGEAYRMIPNTESSKVIIAAYSALAPLMLYDPAEKFQPGSNPILVGSGAIDSTWRPEALIVGSDNIAYAGARPAYGKVGGPLVKWDLNSHIIDVSVPIENESPYSLVKVGTKIVGGTRIENGAGTTPIETQATLFVWNPDTRLVEHQIKMPGTDVRDLIEKEGIVYGFSGSRLFRFNPNTKELNIGGYTAVWPLTQSVTIMPDGNIWGVAASGIFKVDPATDVVSIVRSTTSLGLPITAGFAAKGTDLYFGSGSKLYKYTIPFTESFDPTPPTLTITTPTTGTTITFPKTMSVKATATDNIGVSKVWFFQNGSVVSTDTTVPYEHPWTMADTDNGTYTWMAKAFDAAGNSAFSAPVVVTVSMDDQSPTAPTGLTAAGGVRSVDLVWTASTDAGGSGLKGYALDVSTESSFASYLPGWENKFLGLVVSTRVAGLEADTVYYTRLRAQDNRGNLSGNSLSVSTRTSVLKGEFPLMDGWLWARGALSKSGDTWTYTESTDSGGHYVYKRTTSGLSSSDTLRFSVMVKATASPARDVDLMMYNTDATSNRATAQCALSGAGAVTSVTGGEARAVIGSINALGEGWYLCSVSAKLDGRSGSNLTFFVWGKSGGTSSYAGDPSAGFQFKNPLVVILPEDTEPPTVAIATPTADTTFTAPRTVPVKVTAYNNVGVAKVWFLRNGVVVSTDTAAPYEYSWPVTAANNGAYTWSAAAFDAMGNSATSALIPVTVAIDITPPSAPGSLTASEISSTTLRLSWSSATDNVGVAGYLVQRGTTTIATLAGSVTSFVDSGLSSNTLYRYTVTAFDAAGYVSPLSNELSVSTRRLPLISPLGTVHHTTNRSVELGWEAVAGASRYTLAAGRSKTTESFDAQEESTEGKGSLSGLTANTTYYVYLKACDEEECSPYSFVDAVVTLANVPLLSNAERKGNEIELTIDAQGNPAGTRYRVEMRKGTGEFSPHSEATSLSPVISGLNSGETYHFRVVAINHQGLLTVPSNAQEVILPPDTVDSVRAYPIPYRPGRGADGITFDRLPEETTVRIFSIDGRPVKTLTTSPLGHVLWDLTNDDGSPVTSGTYVVLIEKNGSNKRFKVVVQK